MVRQRGALQHRLDAVMTTPPLIPFKLGVISNTTTDFICPAVVATALRYGIALECIAGPFGQVAQQALAPDTEIKRAQPDAVLIALDFRGFALPLTPGDAVAAELDDKYARYTEEVPR